MAEITAAEKIAITKYDLFYEQRMTRVESSIEHLDKTMGNIDKKLDQTITNINQTMRDIKADFRWLFGVGLLFMGAILFVMAKGFHWF
jgi:hypothetical protein